MKKTENVRLYAPNVQQINEKGRSYEFAATINFTRGW